MDCAKNGSRRQRALSMANENNTLFIFMCIPKHRVYASIAVVEGLLLIAIALCLLLRGGGDGRQEHAAQEEKMPGVMEFDEGYISLHVDREFVLQSDGSAYKGNVDVLKETKKARRRVWEEESQPIDEDLRLHGPYQQTAHESLYVEPFFTISPLAGKIKTHLDSSGKYTIQITPYKEDVTLISIAINFRRVDAEGQEWELVWRPFSPMREGIWNGGFSAGHRWGIEDENK